MTEAIPEHEDLFEDHFDIGLDKVIGAGLPRRQMSEPAKLLNSRLGWHQSQFSKIGGAIGHPFVGKVPLEEEETIAGPLNWTAEQEEFDDEPETEEWGTIGASAVCRQVTETNWPVWIGVPGQSTPSSASQPPALARTLQAPSPNRTEERSLLTYVDRTHPNLIPPRLPPASLNGLPFSAPDLSEDISDCYPEDISSYPVWRQQAPPRKPSQRLEHVDELVSGFAQANPRMPDFEGHKDESLLRRYAAPVVVERRNGLSNQKMPSRNGVKDQVLDLEPRRTQHVDKQSVPDCGPSIAGDSMLAANALAAANGVANPAIMWEEVYTVMLRNIPNKVSQDALIAELDEAGFSNAYDFMYLPIDLETNANRGYAFINFVNPGLASMFRMSFEGRRFKDWNSNKVMSALPAALQGFEANHAHYSKARVRHREAGARPLFVSKDARKNGTKPESLIDVAAKKLAQKQQAHSMQHPFMPSTQQMPYQQENYGYPGNQSMQHNDTWNQSIPNNVSSEPRSRHGNAMRFCPYCGEDFRPDFKFCQYCGQQVV